MQAIVLDVSRSISRTNTGRFTGIDRVEFAYISFYIDWPGPVIFLARLRRRVALLDKNGMRELLVQLSELGRTRKSIASTIRKFSIQWSFSLSALRKYFSAGFTYINVGHGKLRPTLWKSLRHVGAKNITVMIHDVIPLDFPQFCRPKTTRRFAKEFQTMAANADRLLFNSTDTKVRVHHWLDKFDIPQPEGHVLLLGSDHLTHTSAPPPSKTTKPYFVCLGTIEPRKNHALLLEIWEQFHREMPANSIPNLYIVGERGWMNEDVFESLDTADFMGTSVHEFNDMSDEELVSILSGATALLFPSFAEGFGYPLVEALMQNTPVICSDLPCFYEVAGDHPSYLDPSVASDWRDMILDYSSEGGKSLHFKSNINYFPTWEVHFDNLIASIKGKSGN